MEGQREGGVCGVSRMSQIEPCVHTNAHKARRHDAPKGAPASQVAGMIWKDPLRSAGPPHCRTQYLLIRKLNHVMVCGLPHRNPEVGIKFQNGDSS
jgi:hypothetical protein